MVELVDTVVLGATAIRCVGSNPTWTTLNDDLGEWFYPSVCKTGYIGSNPIVVSKRNAGLV